MTTAVKSPITPEEMLNLPDSVNFELVEGKLVEKFSHPGIWLTRSTRRFRSTYPLVYGWCGWSTRERGRCASIVHPRIPPISFLNERDTISGEGVLEGFTCPVAEFFRL